MRTATGTVTSIDTQPSGFGFGLTIPGTRGIYLAGSDAGTRMTLELARRAGAVVTLDYVPGNGRVGTPDGALLRVHANTDGAKLPLAA